MERVIWEFTIGIPIIDEEEEEIETFKNAVFEITEELTKISGGLTYKFCYGTCKSEIMFDDSKAERNFSACITIIVLPELAVDLYNQARTIISSISNTYHLDIIHVQAIKTIGYANHFVI